MNIIEQIKAEIERLNKLLNEGNYYLDNSEQVIGFCAALDEIDTFLSTFESEGPTIPNNHDEAAKEYAKTTFKKPHSDNPDEEVTIIEPDKYAGFIDGAKWQYQKDRAEFAKLKAKEWSDGYNEGIVKGKEQMMSEAVECIVEDWNPEPHPEITIPLNPGKFSNGDRARIIIVKED